MGLSAYAGGFALLIGSSFLLGLGLGGTTLATNLLVAYGSTEHNRRRFYGGLHSMYGISSVIAPAAFALTVKAGLLWGASFAIMSLVVLLPLATGFLTEQVEHEYDTSQKPDRMNVWFRLRVGLAMSFYVASEVAISSRLVLYATNKLSLDPADAAYYLSLFFALLLTGRLSLFLFPLRISTYRLMSLSAATSLALLLLGIFVHPLFMSLCGLTMSIYFPCGMEWISKRFGKNAGYMMTSVMLSITVALIFMHQLMGIATDIFGITNAMLLSVLFLVLAIAALFSNRGSSLDKCIFLEGSSLDKRQV
jgi:fucose permease